MYWRAEFDERTGLITAWEDLIPSDDNECLGQSNASAIEAEARQHWLAVGRKDITRVMQLFSSAAASRYITSAPPPDNAVEDLGGPEHACNASCTQAHYAQLTDGFELINALPSDFNVNGNRVTFALDIEGYPRHPQGVPADGASALIARGVAMWTIETTSTTFQITSEEVVLERLQPAPKLTSSSGNSEDGDSIPPLLLVEDFETVDHGDSKWEQDLNGRSAYIRQGPRDIEPRTGGSVDFAVSYCPDGSCYRAEYKRPTAQRSKDLRLGETYWFVSAAPRLLAGPLQS